MYSLNLCISSLCVFLACKVGYEWLILLHAYLQVLRIERLREEHAHLLAAAWRSGDNQGLSSRKNVFRREGEGVPGLYADKPVPDKPGTTSQVSSFLCVTALIAFQYLLSLQLFLPFHVVVFQWFLFSPAPPISLLPLTSSVFLYYSCRTAIEPHEKHVRQARPRSNFSAQSQRARQAIAKAKATSGAPVWKCCTVS